MILPPAPLRLLARRKLHGALRKQVRRLRTTSGLIFAVCGALVLGAWIFSLVLGWAFGVRDALAPEELYALVRLGCLALFALSIASSLNHRGLYLPAEELEPLLSAPVSRPDLVRYRLMVNTGRTLFGVLILGLLIMGRSQRPPQALLGVFLGLQTLAVLGQANSILAGKLEKRLVKGFLRGPGALLALGLTVCIGLLAVGLVVGDGATLGLGEWLSVGGPRELLNNPVLATATLPFEPWARLIAAESDAATLAWGGLCLFIWLAAIELTARLPIDFRELSLETSASVAEKIRRHRRTGGGASASRVSRRSVGWSIPRLFGHGPAGALAWRKTVSIVRKARGTMTVSVLVLAFLTILTASILQGDAQEEVLIGGLLIACLGTLYLCGGLRFDFREDLDRMEVIKTWPIQPARLFAAMLLAEVALVSVLLAIATLARCAITGTWHALLAPGLCGLPLFVMAWVSIDNIVFLLSPVRLVPGQDGVLQNAGRAMIVGLARLAFFGTVTLATAGLTAAAWFGLHSGLGAASGLSAALCAALALLLLLLADLLLVRLGGWALQRFDVARDRG